MFSGYDFYGIIVPGSDFVRTLSWFVGGVTLFAGMAVVRTLVTGIRLLFDKPGELEKSDNND